MLSVIILFDTAQALYSRIFISWEPALAFCYPDTFWFFSSRYPNEHYLTIHSVQNKGHPWSNDVPASLPPNALPLCQISSCFLIRQSTFFSLVYT